MCIEPKRKKKAHSSSRSPDESPDPVSPDTDASKPQQRKKFSFFTKPKKNSKRDPNGLSVSATNSQAPLSNVAPADIEAQNSIAATELNATYCRSHTQIQTTGKVKPEESSYFGQTVNYAYDIP